MLTNEKCKKCKSFKYCRGDSYHTWNYDENMPNMCMKEILEEDGSDDDVAKIKEEIGKLDK